MATPNSEADPTILHVDMDAFFASVEMLEDPSLSGRPLIVGGDGIRGVVASCNYEARSFGIRSAMPSVRAKRLCPHAVFVSGRYGKYEEYSHRMHAVFQEFTPTVEALSLDEAFLDVTGAQRLFGRPEEIAWEIRKRIQERLGLDASVGVATTKHVAKLASVAAKPKASRRGPIDGKGVVCVRGHEALAFLHPLPVRALWGVGPAAGDRLARLGIATVGQLAAYPLDGLVAALGSSAGRHLHDLAWNRDDRPVEPDRAMKSVGHEQTYAHDLVTRSAVHDQLVRLADAVASRMRKSEVSGRTITVKIRFGTFRTITRSRTLKAPTANASLLLAVSDELTEVIEVDEGVRLLGLSVSNLDRASSSEQLSFDDAMGSDHQHRERDVVLDRTLDDIRERFGDAALVPAPLVAGAGLLRRGDQQWGPGSGGVQGSERPDRAMPKPRSAAGDKVPREG